MLAWFLWIACVTSASAEIHVRALDSPHRIPGQYIVTLEEGHIRGSVARDVARNSNGQIIATYSRALNGFAIRIDDRRLDSLRFDPRIAAVEADQLIFAHQVQSPAPWGLDRIDQRNLPLNNSYSYIQDGAGVHVYVIDSGLRSTHTEFTGRIGNGKHFVGTNTTDCTGHGTHVTGIVAGTTWGVAKQATVHPVRVFECAITTPISTVISGVDWVANNALFPAVANMSLTGAPSTALDDAVRNVIADGVFVAVAAGNDGVNACTKSPARVSEAVTVGATDIGDQRAIFPPPQSSNTGTCVDVFAPGKNITSAGHTGNTASAVLSGTSMSSPHVAGIAALYLGDSPAALPAQVSNDIVGNATVGVLGGLGSGSPNRLAYSIFANGPLPPTIPVVTREFLTCPGVNRPSYMLRWDADRPVIEYDADFNTNGNPWVALYNGPNPWKTINTFSGHTYNIRVRARDGAGWGAFKQLSFVAETCGGGNF